MKPKVEVVGVGMAREARQRVSGSVGRGPFSQQARDVSFIQAHIVDASFADCRFVDLYTEASRFDRCDFREARLRGGTLGPMRPAQTTYSDCDFRGVDLRAITAGNSRFEQCRFDEANVDGWTPDCAEFIGCSFAGRIAGARFTGSTRLCGVDIGRTHSDFLENDFTAASLETTSFEWGVDLKRQRLPTGGQYLLVGRSSLRLEAVRRTIVAWPPKDRKEAEFLLGLLESPGMMAQQDIFLESAGFISPTIADRFWALATGADFP